MAFFNKLVNLKDALAAALNHRELEGYQRITSEDIEVFEDGLKEAQRNHDELVSQVIDQYEMLYNGAIKYINELTCEIAELTDKLNTSEALRKQAVITLDAVLQNELNNNEQNDEVYIEYVGDSETDKSLGDEGQYIDQLLIENSQASELREATDVLKEVQDCQKKEIDSLIAKLSNPGPVAVAEEIAHLKKEYRALQRAKADTEERLLIAIDDNSRLTNVLNTLPQRLDKIEAFYIEKIDKLMIENMDLKNSNALKLAKMAQEKEVYENLLQAAEKQLAEAQAAKNDAAVADLAESINTVSELIASQTAVLKQIKPSNTYQNTFGFDEIVHPLKSGRRRGISEKSSEA